VRSSGILATVLVAGVLVLTGCGTTVSPRAVSAPPDTPTSATSTSVISDPLDISKFAADTCSGLTAAQVSPYLGALDRKIPHESSQGTVCTFEAKNLAAPALGIGESDAAAPTEELLYESVQNVPWRQKIDPIASYPAVDSSATASGKGDCATDVSISDTQNLHGEFRNTGGTGPHYESPCVPAEALMALLIENIKSGVA
jgi:hypothetical protein